MYLNKTRQTIDVVTVHDVSRYDSLHIQINYVDHGGGERQLGLIFRPALQGSSWRFGSGWFVLDMQKSDIWIRSTLQNRALRLYDNLPWWRRLTLDDHVAIEWVEKHVEFAIRTSIASEHELHYGRPPAKGQLVKGWFLEVVPFVDGKRVHDRIFPDGVIQFGWPVGDVVHQKAYAV